MGYILLKSSYKIKTQLSFLEFGKKCIIQILIPSNSMELKMKLD